MSAPLYAGEYPQYFITPNTLLAFTSPTTMYKIEQVGSNSGNKGVCIDYYITRKMVLSHFPSSYLRVHVKTFQAAAHKLFNAYINKMTVL